MLDIEKQTGIAGPTVRRILDLKNEPIRPENIMPRYDEATRREVVRLYVEEELSALQVGRKLNLEPFTVKMWVNDAGVGRSMSEAAALSISKHGQRDTSRYRTRRRYYTSTTTGMVVVVASTYELLRAQQLDANRAICFWDNCWDRIPYIDDSGKQRHYVPDFSVAFGDGRL